MSLEDYAQLSFGDFESFHCNDWTKESYGIKGNDHYKSCQINDISSRNYYREKLCTSFSTPTKKHSNEDVHQVFGAHEKNQFLREISQVREDILRFRTEMNGLAKQMNGMEVDLNDSKDRVREIEKGLMATQEVNVNLQVLLEKAVNKQKETDVYATRAMRHIHTNLANVVHETGQLRGRLITIANYQKQHQGSVDDVAERIREYMQMLEQAQGTIQSLQEPSNRIRLLLSPEEEDVMNSLDLRNYSTDEDDDDDDEETSYQYPMPSTNSSKEAMRQSPMIIGALILLVDLWIVYGALMSSRSIAFKLGWTITVFLFPFGGLLLYLPVTFLLLQ